jgi:hypothetical protein
MYATSAWRFGAIALTLSALTLSLLVSFAPPARAQQPSGVSISWQVKSRFRLFKNEEDFKYMAANYDAGGVLASENKLAAATGGNGWARRIVNGLCVDSSGELLQSCTRDYSTNDPSGREAFAENYLAPSEHGIGVTAHGTPADAKCTWKFVTKDADAKNEGTKATVKRDQPCSEETFVRVAYGQVTQVQLFVAANAESGPPTATTDVNVRDILIVGLGDSTAAGEGNPDRPVVLADNGFCFGRFLSGDIASYYRPSRAGYSGSRACGSDPADAINWTKQRALWMSAACHRSLYSYQLRLALALAIENPQIAVTFIPLACTGATIPSGLLGSQFARESNCDFSVGGAPCRPKVNGQLDTLNELLAAAHKQDKNRNPDLVLLSVGANDIDFSGLVANVMIDPATFEYKLFRDAGLVSNVATAKKKLNGELPGNFADMRTALKRVLGNKLDRVIYASYGHPALYNNGETCPSSRQGFDVHPVFKIDGAVLKSTSEFVTDVFFPRLKALAMCDNDNGGGCRSPSQDRMTFVDDHQAQFKNHGYCAQADSDPAFDRDCFKADGNSFQTDRVRAADDPLTCRGKWASSFRAYASRQRWIRTANDSYFAAMTYPSSVPLHPADIHDPLWGATSAVYGGAMHPTAQGYAAIADAVLPAARQLLQLPPPR